MAQGTVKRRGKDCDPICNAQFSDGSDVPRGNETENGDGEATTIVIPCPPDVGGPARPINLQRAASWKEITFTDKAGLEVTCLVLVDPVGIAPDLDEVQDTTPGNATITLTAEDGQGNQTVTTHEVLCGPFTATEGPAGTYTFNWAGFPDGEFVIETGNVTDNGDGTATVTFPDGSTKDDVVCGVQSTIVYNPGVGWIVTQNDGTEELIPETNPSSVTFANGVWTHDDGEGNTESWGPFPPSTVTFADGVWTHDDGNGTTISWGPFEPSVECCNTAVTAAVTNPGNFSGGGLTIGVNQSNGPNLDVDIPCEDLLEAGPAWVQRMCRVQIGAGSWTNAGSDPDLTTYGEICCPPITLQCDQAVIISGVWSVVGKGPVGQRELNSFYSTDGGASWAPTSGGQDSFPPTNTPMQGAANQGEQYVPESRPVNLAAGTYEFCFRWEYNTTGSNNDTVSDVTIQNGNFTISYVEGICK